MTDANQSFPSEYVDELAARNAALDADVKERVALRRQEVGAVELPSFSDYYAVQLSEASVAVIGEAGYDPRLIAIGPPTKKNDATKGVDVAMNVARVAKSVGESPLETAVKIADSFSNVEGIDTATTIGPFVNLGYDYTTMTSRVLAQVEAAGPKYGHFRDGDPKLVVIDYSSPNVAKNMTVAHLRSTIIGKALVNLTEASGDIGFGINHVGDWGTQFGNIIYQYRKELAERGDDFKADIDKDPTGTLMRIYRDFTAQKEANPESAKEAATIFRQLEAGDPELVELWTQFRAWSLRDFGPTYERLGIEFDAFQGESFYEDRMDAAVLTAVEAGVLSVDADGAVVLPSQPLTDPSTGTENTKVMLDKNGEPRPEIILKPNGGTVYLTRDLAAIAYRSRELGADKIMYVIGKEQQVHCWMLFAMADQLGHAALGSAVHISFGHLNVGGRKMKSREGKVVLLNDLLDESATAAENMLLQRRGENDAPLNPEELEIARQIGTGALIFNDLSHDRRNDIEFNPDVAATIQAGGAAYIQYTDARIASVLRKFEGIETGTDLPEELLDQEKALIAQMAQLPIVIKDAASESAPHKLATYLSDFCQTVSAFYRDAPVIGANTQVEQYFRIRLLSASRQVIANAANLLHFELPGQM